MILGGIQQKHSLKNCLKPSEQNKKCYYAKSLEFI
jgi:hypothetical protein